jgi:hypothetical protein
MSKSKRESITFLPIPKSTAAHNLDLFITLCRDKLTIFGAVDFDALVWNVGKVLNSKARRSDDSLFFSTLATSHQGAVKEPLHQNFDQFAKSYIRYKQGISPVTLTPTTNRIRALQALEQALLECGQSCPTKVDASVLDRAAGVIKALNQSVGKRYAIGGALEKLGEFLNENRLVNVGFSWKNWLSPPPDNREKVGRQFDDRRNALLPMQEHLEALGVAYHRATNPSDILASSILGLLLCQPGRISEVLHLPVNCILQRDDGKHGVLLRYRPVKGAAPVLKPVTATMTDVAIDAVRKISELTNAAREVAKFYEKNPTRLYLQPKLKHLRKKEFISAREMGKILWGESFDSESEAVEDATDRALLSSVLTWAARNGMEIPNLPPKRTGLLDAFNIPRIRFSDLERAVLKRLPDGFPIFEKSTGLKFSEALCISRVHEFDSKKRVLVCMITHIGVQQISRRVDERSDSGTPSIFERTGVRSQDGSPIRITTKQLRHFLNTIAQAANMDRFDLAAWSGRKDIRQNTAYDHVSTSERVEEMRESVVKAAEKFSPPTLLKKYIPVLRSEFALEKVRTGHLTDLGHCVHDFVMAPCQKFGDHINCEEHIVIKGDPDVETRIRRSLEENQVLYERAHEAVQRGNLSAQRWLDLHAARLARFNEIVQILDDDKIEKGALIRLSIPDSPSRIKDAARQRAVFDCAITYSPIGLKQIKSDSATPVQEVKRLS